MTDYRRGRRARRAFPWALHSAISEKSRRSTHPFLTTRRWTAQSAPSVMQDRSACVQDPACSRPQSTTLALESRRSDVRPPARPAPCPSLDPSYAVPSCGASASTRLPMATRTPSAVTSPSILIMPPMRPATRADGLEDRVRPRGARKLEGAKRRHPKRPAWRPVDTAGGDTAGLGKKLDQHDGRHHRIAGEMPLKVPIVRLGETAPARRLARRDVDDCFDQPHRNSMRQQIDKGGAGSHVEFALASIRGILSTMSTHALDERFRRVCRDSRS